MKLKIVIEPYSLQWPEALQEASGRFRGPSGYIVDVTAPCEGAFLAGQENKLRNLTPCEIKAYEEKFSRKVKPGVITNPMALAAIHAELAGVPYAPLAVAEQIKANADAAALAAEASDLGIPDPEDPEPPEIAPVEVSPVVVDANPAEAKPVKVEANPAKPAAGEWGKK